VIPVVSLFSGSGGMDLGFRQQGFVPLLALDSNQVAVDTYNLNHPGHVAQKADLSLVSGEDIVARVEARDGGHIPRGVIGGPPCQPFSRGNVQSKAGDPRRRLPRSYAEILETLNRRYHLDFFVFENVTGMQSKAHLEVYDELTGLLDMAGFKVYVGILDASRFGLAQVRRRVFIVGLNKELHPEIQFDFPEGQNGSPTSVRDAIWGLPEPVYFRRNLSTLEIPFHPNHWTMQPRSPKFANGTVGIKSRSFRRLDWDKPSWTVAYGHREIHVHPEGHRRLSVFEAMLLQGFPREYLLPGNFSQQVTLVSDAVPPPLAAAVASSVREVLEEPATEPYTTGR
jgi:DNA (cytosine-5)-methyltransferase 1